MSLFGSGEIGLERSGLFEPFSLSNGNAAVAPPEPTVRASRPADVPTITEDSQGPTADIVDVTPDPRTAPVGTVPINFSEPVTGVDIADFTLIRDGAGVDISGLAVIGSDSYYTIDLSSVTATPGAYVLTLVAAGSGIQDLAGNLMAANASDAWTMPPNHGPVVTAPLSDMSVDEDAPNTTLNLAAAFSDNDPGDSLNYSVVVEHTVQNVVDDVRESSYKHLIENRLYTHLLDNRGSFGPERELARESIAAYFAGLGLPTVQEQFGAADRNCYNVVATQTGATRPDEVYLVGAHYNSISSNPGADDNASGVAAVMELARVLSSYQFEATLKFVAFDMFRSWPEGSIEYVRQHASERIRGMINLDMIAYNPGGLNKVRLYDARPGGEIKTDLAAAFQAYGRGVTAVDSGQTRIGDHRAFEEDGGDDAAMVTEYEFASNPHYYKPTDSVDTPGYLDYPFAVNVAGAVAGYLATKAVLIDATSLLTATVAGDVLTLDYLENRSGSVSVTVRATDLAGASVEDSFIATIAEVNDAPVLDPTGDMFLSAIDDNTPSGGTLVSAIIASGGGDRITDIDVGACEGIAIIDAAAGIGVWEYSTDDGASWLPIGSPSAGSARLLAADNATRVRFVPPAGFSGLVDPGVTFRAWDQSSGVNGGIGDATIYGESSAFSVAIETASITVTPICDPPVVIVPTAPIRINADTYLIAGTAEAGSLVSIYRDVNNDGRIGADESLVGQQQLDEGETAFAINARLSPGGNELLVVASNATTTSPPADVPRIMYDSWTTPPVITNPGAAVLLNAAAFAVEGTAEANSSVKVYVDANNNNVLDTGEGLAGQQQLSGGATDFSVVVALTRNAANNFIVIATDDLGNVSDPADVPTINEDSLPPAPPLVVSPASAVIVNADTYVIAGEAEAYSWVRVYADANDNDQIDVGEALVGEGPTTGGFGTGGRVHTDVGMYDDYGNAIALQPDGKILLGGYSYISPGHRFAIVRYNPDGSLDTTFAGDGKLATEIGSDAMAFCMAIQADGKIVLGGTSDSKFALTRYDSDGSLDASFDGDGIVTTVIGSAAYGWSLALQPDGKILLAGQVTIGGKVQGAVARYLPDGSLDTSFDGDGVLTMAIDDSSVNINSVALQPDGRILLGGVSRNAADTDFAVVRCNPDGSLDMSFGGDGKVSTALSSNNDVGRALAIQPDGRIILAGDTYTGSKYNFALARYNPDGSLDNSFSGDGKCTTSLGTLSGAAYSVALQPDGRILLAGDCYSTVVNVGDFAVVRYNADGSLDGTFDGDGKVVVAFPGVENARGMVVGADGSIHLGGRSRSSDFFSVVKLRSNGSLDLPTSLSFSVALSQNAANNFVVTATDGIGNVSLPADVPTIVEGSTPPPAPVITSPPSAVRIDADTFVISGTAQPGSVVRIYADENNNGQVDTGESLAGQQPVSLQSFDGDGWVTTSWSSYDYGHSVAVGADGTIVLAGNTRVDATGDFAVIRYLPDGTLDPSFSGDGMLTTAVGSGSDEGQSVVVMPDGKILVAGQSYSGTTCDSVIVRYNSDGTLDSTFGGDGIVSSGLSSSDYGYSLAVQPDGKILVAGHGYSSVAARHDFFLARYHPDGTPDTSFDGDGRVATDLGSLYDCAYSMALQPDGRILLAGSTSWGDFTDLAVVRYNSDGTLDTSFDGDGKLRMGVGATNQSVRDIAVQADGKILLGGHFHNGSNDDFVVVRLNPDGSLDEGFGSGGKAMVGVLELDQAGGIVVQPDGKIVLSGTSTRGISTYATLLRFNADGSLDTAFDGDGKLMTYAGADVALQPDGKIVVGGSHAPALGNSDFALARYGVDGRLDAAGFAITVALSQDAVNHFVATATEGAANVSPPIAIPTITEDSQHPASPIVITPAAAMTLDAPSLAITGTAPADSLVRVYVDANDSNEVDAGEALAGTLQLTGGETAFSITVSLGQNAVHYFVVTATDALGDVSPAGDVPMVKEDSIVPPPPSVTDPASATTVNSSPYLIRGFADYDSLVSIYVDANNNNAVDAGEVLAGQQQLAGFDGDGLVTTSIGPTNESGNSVALQPDGKIVLGGYTNNGLDRDFALVRYNTDGSLDTTFSGNGRVTTAVGRYDDFGNAVALQADGKILLAGAASDGSTYDFTLARYNADGSLDTTFGSGGKVVTAVSQFQDVANAIAVQADGKILLGGYSYSGLGVDLALVRYNPDGSLDPTFGGDGIVTSDVAGVGYGHAMALQPDGRIVLAGDWYLDGSQRMIALRYNTDGSPDTTFDGDGVATADVGGSTFCRGVAVQSDGKIVLAGWLYLPEVFAAVRFNSDGTLDTTFDGDGKVTTDVDSSYDEALSVAVQADGKILLAGRSYSSMDRFALVRYNADGSLDTGFSGDGKHALLFPGAAQARSVALAADGKIVVTGGGSDFALARYHADGVLDAATSFAISAALTPDTANNFVVRATDAAGHISAPSDVPTITADSLAPEAPTVVDPGAPLAVNAASCSIQGIAEANSLVRVYVDANNNNQVDAGESLAGQQQLSAGETSFAISVGLLQDAANNFLVTAADAAGSVSSPTDVPTITEDSQAPTAHIANVTPDPRTTCVGGLYFSFSEGVTGVDIADFTLTRDGASIDLGGLSVAGWNRTYMVDLSTVTQAPGAYVLTLVAAGSGIRDLAGNALRDGTDEGWTRQSTPLLPPAVSSPSAAVAVNADTYLVEGAAAAETLVRLYVDANDNGAADPGETMVDERTPRFDSDGKQVTPVGTTTDMGRAVAVQADGKIVMGGYSHNGSDEDFAVVRYNSDGSLDASFSGDGKTTTAVGPSYDYATSLAIQPDGKILLAGYSYNGSNADMAVVRYNADGTLDATFSGDGMLTQAIGTSQDMAYAVTVQPDGKILLGGYTRTGGDENFVLVRYHGDGTLDTSFSGDGIETTAIGTWYDQAFSIALQSDGKILLGGRSYNNGNYDFSVVRYNGDGTLDTSFSGDGKLLTAIGGEEDSGQSVAVQADGKILLGGRTQTGADYDFALVRYNSDGTLDSGFSGDGLLTTSLASWDSGQSIAVQGDGKILLGGYCHNFSSNSDFAVVRYNSNGTLDASFSGDGKLTTPVGSDIDDAYGIAVQADGKIVQAGATWSGGKYDFAVVRYLADGSLDGGDGFAFKVPLAQDATNCFVVTATDGGGNEAATDVPTITEDSQAPTADIVDVTPDPRSTAVGIVTTLFSEGVSGVRIADFTLTRDGVGVDISGLAVTGSGTSYMLDLSSVTTLPGSYVLTLVAAGSGIQDAAGNALAAAASDAWTMASSDSNVVGRHIFYNNSYFDGNPTAGRDDDNAIATDKQALLPGQTAGFAHYTSYSRGINGIMIDFDDLPDTLTTADFQFNVGNTTTPDTWAAGPEPTIAIRRDVGAALVDRVVLVWPDAPDPGSIAKQWLQVTVLANERTGLSSPDVFYFGNAVGDSGLGNTATRAYVDGTDFAGARDNPHNFANRALVDDTFDFNRDSFVDGTDLAIVRDNNTNLATALRLFTMPGGAGSSLMAAAWPGSDLSSARPTSAPGDVAGTRLVPPALATSTAKGSSDRFPVVSTRPGAAAAMASQIARDALLAEFGLPSQVAARRERWTATLERPAAVSEDVLSLLADAVVKTAKRRK